MTQTQTRVQSATYTDADVENVMRRVRADLVMIANSTGCWSEEEARNFAHDIEVFAKKGYLKWVDVTLCSYGAERQAVRYTLSKDAASWTTSRPGALWPRVPSPTLLLMIQPEPTYTSTAEDALRYQLKMSWGSTTRDASHAALSTSGGRDYASASFGMQRKDWGQ